MQRYFGVRKLPILHCIDIKMTYETVVFILSDSGTDDIEKH